VPLNKKPAIPRRSAAKARRAPVKAKPGLTGRAPAKAKPTATHSSSAKKSARRSLLDDVRALAAGLPDAERAFLFGDHEVYRVRKKVFLWLGEGEDGTPHLGVKLKDSQHAALMLPFVTPMAYGMAKWGWVNVDFPKGKFSSDLSKEWITESYRHTAPKKLLALLG
jgi:predicted DNA-binding protein (MmcQ/YjbR family)